MNRSKTLETQPQSKQIRWSLWLLAGATSLLVCAGAYFLVPQDPYGLTSPDEKLKAPNVSASPTLPPTPSLSPPAAPTLTPAPSSTPPPTSSPTISPVPPTPTPANPQVIGASAVGRPIQVYRFGDGPSERLIVAGIHGGYEWNTIHLAEKMIDYLEDHPGLVPDQVTLYILPNLNPDGYARSRGIHGRANDHGVDLNRNFPALWQKNWPREGCWSYLPISGGERAASEPETQALIQFISSRELEALISYHSAALGIFAGGQPPDPASVALAEAVAYVSTYPYPPYDLGCKFTGQLIDWTASQGIPSLDIELANHQDLDWEQNLRILEVFLTWEP
jgi:hypothetical protein